MQNQDTKFHPVHSVYDGVFNTATGKKINILNPDPDTIDIEDIAIALSNICRFGGNIKQFYSVAQHSMLVCSLAPPHLKLEALLHDSAEAYVGDVIKPLKVILGTKYEAMEARFMAAICFKFQLRPDRLQAIKPYDMEALELEHARLQLGQREVWDRETARLGIGRQIGRPRDLVVDTFLRMFKMLGNSYSRQKYALH